jgi:hypothetical protein
MHSNSIVVASNERKCASTKPPLNYVQNQAFQWDLKQARSTLYVALETFSEFGLHTGNMKLNTG